MENLQGVVEKDGGEDFGVKNYEKKKTPTTLTCRPWEVGLKDEGNQTIKIDFFVCTQMFPWFLCLCRLLHV